MKLIDANVLLYAVGGPHAYKMPSARTLAQIRSGDIGGNVSTEILQEVLNYFRRQGKSRDGFRMFDDLWRQFPSPFPIVASTALSARDLLERHPSIQTRDAFHAAVVFENKLEGIISADRGFDVIDGLVRFDPKELAA